MTELNLCGLDSYHRAFLAAVKERDWDAVANLRSLALALGRETGELQEVLQWIPDSEIEDRLANEDDLRRSLAHECVDVMNYVFRVAQTADIDLVQAAWEKLGIIKQRYPVERARGTTIKYTEFRDGEAL